MRAHKEKELIINIISELYSIPTYLLTKPVISEKGVSLTINVRMEDIKKYFVVKIQKEALGLPFDVFKLAETMDLSDLIRLYNSIKGKNRKEIEKILSIEERYQFAKRLVESIILDIYERTGREPNRSYISSVLKLMETDGRLEKFANANSLEDLKLAKKYVKSILECGIPVIYIERETGKWVGVDWKEDVPFEEIIQYADKTDFLHSYF